MDTTMHPKKNVTLVWLLRAGCLAALCWTVADVLLVGFVVHPENYPLLSKTLNNDLDSELALLMLEASPLRLMWGVWLATFSMVFYLIGALGVYQLLPNPRIARWCVGLLISGYALSPLAHAGFFYIGISAQTLLNSHASDLSAQIAQFNLFYQLLASHWVVSVTLSAMGWLAILVQTLRGKTLLPRGVALFNPLLVGILVMVSCSFFPLSPVAAAIHGATFSVAQLSFFVSAQFSVSVRPSSPLHHPIR